MQISAALSGRYVFAMLLSLGVLAFPLVTQAEDDGAKYLRALIAESREKQLADTRLWHLLLHYKPKFVGGVKSEADGDGFFFHPHGKTNPQGELEATLQAFF